jgi:hypothetical protein
MTDTDTRDSKARYTALLGTIRANTGHGQPPLLSASGLWVIIGNSSMAHTDGVRAMQAARENGAVIRWVDGEGTVRYALTQSGFEMCDSSLPPYAAEDGPALRGVIETEASRAEPDRDVIGWANRWLGTLETDDRNS